MVQTFRFCKVDFLCCHRAYSTGRHYEHYKILGISRNATRKEIREAFVKRSKELHPDVSGKQNHDEFVKLTEAYNILNKPEPVEQFRRDNTVRNETYSEGYNPYSTDNRKQYYYYYDESNVRKTINRHIPWTSQQVEDYVAKFPNIIMVFFLNLLLLTIILQYTYLREQRMKDMGFLRDKSKIITPRD